MTYESTERTGQGKLKAGGLVTPGMGNKQLEKTFKKKTHKDYKVEKNPRCIDVSEGTTTQFWKHLPQRSRTLESNLGMQKERRN